MGYPLFTFKEYIKYRLRAKNAHGLHSPFLYQLYTKVIQRKDNRFDQSLLELRKSYLKNNQKITYTDPKTGNSKTKRLSVIGRKAAASHKFSSFLRKLSEHLKAQCILETGTSIGITTSYLAINSEKPVVTLEGSKEIASIANANFKLQNLENIKLIQGNIHETFLPSVEKYRPDFIFLDAEHIGKTVSFYLEGLKPYLNNIKCIIIHDIYWSEDMKASWKDVKDNLNYRLTVDLFEAGLIFPNYPIEKQHFSLKF